MRINLNTILIILGSLGVFVPGLELVSTWLASLDVAWIGSVVRALGLLAAFCSAAPLAVPKLRTFLAGLGLATPPGAQAPWDPKAQPAVVPMPPPAVPTATDDIVTKPVVTGATPTGKL